MNYSTPGLLLRRVYVYTYTRMSCMRVPKGSQRKRALAGLERSI